MKKPLLFLLFCTTFCLSQAMEEIPAVPPTEEAQLYEFRPLFEKYKEGIRSSTEQSIREGYANMVLPENWCHRFSYEQIIRSLENVLEKIEDPETFASAEFLFNEPRYRAAFISFSKKIRPGASLQEIRNTVLPAWVEIRDLLDTYRGNCPAVAINLALQAELAYTVADVVGGRENLIQEFDATMSLASFRDTSQNMHYSPQGIFMKACTMLHGPLHSACRKISNAQNQKEKVTVARIEEAQPTVPRIERDRPGDFRALIEKYKVSMRSSLEQNIRETPDREEKMQKFERLIENPEALAAAEKAFNEPVYHNAFMKLVKRTRPTAPITTVKRKAIPAWITAFKLLSQYNASSPEALINGALQAAIAYTVADTFGGREALLKELNAAIIMRDIVNSILPNNI